MVVLLLKFIDLADEFICLLRRHRSLPVWIHIISKTIPDDDRCIALKESIWVAYRHTLTLSMPSFLFVSATSENFHFKLLNIIH